MADEYRNRFIVAYDLSTNTFLITHKTNHDWCDKAVYHFSKDAAMSSFKKNIKMYSTIHESLRVDKWQKMFYLAYEDDLANKDCYAY